MFLDDFIGFLLMTLVIILIGTGLIFGITELDYLIYGQRQADSYNTACGTKLTASQLRFLNGSIKEQMCSKPNIRVKFSK